MKRDDRKKINKQRDLFTSGLRQVFNKNNQVTQTEPKRRQQLRERICHIDDNQTWLKAPRLASHRTRHMIQLFLYNTI